MSLMPHSLGGSSCLCTGKGKRIRRVLKAYVMPPDRCIASVHQGRSGC